MGDFSSSLLIRSSDAKSVAKELIQFASKDGYDAHDDTSVDHEGAAIAIFSCAGQWTVVLESEACTWDADESLSKKLKTSVVDLSVHDSDIWTYYWYENGKLVDQHSNTNMHEYFGVDTSLFDDDDYEFSEEEKDNGLSKLTLNQRWKALKKGLAKGTSRESFDAVLEPEETVGGEQGLGEFLDLVGLPEEIAYLCYSYWAEDQSTEELKLERVVQFTES